MNKNFREGYKRRRDDVAAVIQKITSGHGNGSFVTPSLPVHRQRDAVAQFFQPHLALFYLSLIIVGMILFTRGL